MHVLIISPLREGYMNLCGWLDGLKSERVTILTQTKYENNMNKMLKLNNQDEFCQVKSIEAFTDDNVIWNGLKINRENKIDVVFAYTEEMILPAARLREELGINGQSVKSAKAFRDKWTMYETLCSSELSLNVPQTFKVEGIEDVLKLEDKFPVVLKPRFGAGSVDTFVIKKTDDLGDLTSKADLSNYIAQTFVEGDVYHIDALVLDNEIKYSVVSKYFNTPLCYQDQKSISSIQIEQTSKIALDLKKLTEDVLRAMPTPQSTIVHLEAFHDGKKATFLEVGSRIGGGRINQEFVYNLGIDPDKILLEHMTGHDSSNELLKEIDGKLSKRRCGFVLTAPGKGVLTKLPPQSLFDVPSKNAYDYYIYGRTGRKYDYGHSSVDAIAAVSVFGKTTDGILQELRKINEWVDFSSAYEEEDKK